MRQPRRRMCAQEKQSFTILSSRRHATRWDTRVQTQAGRGFMPDVPATANAFVNPLLPLLATSSPAQASPPRVPTHRLRPVPAGVCPHLAPRNNHHAFPQLLHPSASKHSPPGKAWVHQAGALGAGWALGWVPQRLSALPGARRLTWSGAGLMLPQRDLGGLFLFVTKSPQGAEKTHTPPSTRLSKTLSAKGGGHEKVKNCQVCKVFTCAGSKLYFMGCASVMPTDVWKNLDSQNTKTQNTILSKKGERRSFSNTTTEVLFPCFREGEG